MHREEFTDTLIRDEFISALIEQIQQISSELKIDEINAIISLIEEDIDSEKQEMTRFTEFLTAQLKSYIESEDEELINDTNFVATDGPISESLNLTSKNDKKNLISKDIGIDDLVKYIVEDEKPKKSKKKRKNKNKNKQKTNPTTNHQLSPTNYSSNPDASNLVISDREVDMFKEDILKNSKNATSTKKIRPVLTPNWIENLVNETENRTIY